MGTGGGDAVADASRPSGAKSGAGRGATGRAGSADSGVASELLSAPHVVEYTYRRSLGPVLSAFFTGLRDRQLQGVRAADGRVLVPPREYDPETGAPLTELVPLGEGGVVRTWCWVARPRPKQPLSRPFAYALVQPDGADGALLHCVDAGAPERMRTGMRVRALWSEAPEGSIRDLACYLPEETA